MKKRLKLLNEVLPTPEPARSGSPRTRVLKHAAKIATGAVVTAACTGYGVVDPLPDPSYYDAGDLDGSRRPDVSVNELDGAADAGPDVDATTDASFDAADAGDVTDGSDANDASDAQGDQ